MRGYRLSPPVGVLSVSIALLLSGCAARHRPSQLPPEDTQTVATVQSQAVTVRADQSVPEAASRAEAAFQRYLVLMHAEPALRAETMRRLATIKLESGERERAETDALEASPASTRAAIALYSQLLKDYPDYPKKDVVLYELARAYEAERQPEQALEALEALGGGYPSSHFAAEANFRRGEIYFGAKRWVDADAAYTQVIAQGTGSEFYEQSLYKQGWSRFKQSEFDSGLHSFSMVLSRYLQDAQGQPKSIDSLARPQRELVDDTLRISAIIFSFDDNSQAIDRFTEREGPKTYDALLYDALGQIYLSKERWIDAADAYHAYVKRSPEDSLSPSFLLRAIDALTSGRFVSLVVDQKKEYLERYAPDSAFWTAHPELINTAVYTALRGTFKDLAGFYHAQAQTSHAPADYEEAAHWYLQFIRFFPRDPEAADTHYLYADSLFESQQYERAVDEYVRTAYDYPNSARAAVAGYAALVAYEKREAQLSEPEKAAWHARGLQETEHFALVFSAHPESNALLARTARAWYELHDDDQALRVANELLLRHDTLAPSEQQTGLTVLANIRFERGEFAAAEVAYQQLLAIVPVTDARTAALAERLAACIYKQGEALQATGQSTQAVDQFLRVASATPDAAIRVTATYDAASLLLGLKDWHRAIEVLLRFRQDFPRDARQSEVTRRLAVAYAEAELFAESAVEFANISTAADASLDMQREALDLVAQYKERAGDLVGSNAALEQYVQRFSDHFEQAMEARQKLADAAANRHDGVARVRWLSALIKAEAAPDSLHTDRARSLASHAALELARNERDRFNAIELTQPLKKSLATKRQVMQQALSQLEAANAYGIADVATAATFDIAEIYRRLASDLMKSERPKNLSAETLEQYDVLIEEQAFPFEEQSIDVHMVNVGRAASGVYDVSVRASYAALAVLKPARFGKREVDVEWALTPDEAPVEGAASTPSALAIQWSGVLGLIEVGDTAAGLTAFTAWSAQPGRAGALASYNAGVLLARAGRAVEAEAQLLHSLEQLPDQDRAYVELGFVYRLQGRFVEARQAYGEALRLKPDSRVAHQNAGILSDLYTQQPEEALHHYEAALALTSPDSMPLAAWVAELKQRLGIKPKVEQSEDGSHE